MGYVKKEWKSLLKYPQCNADFKKIEDTSLSYECGSIMYLLGEKQGCLRSTGTCATNGIYTFNEYRESVINSQSKE